MHARFLFPNKLKLPGILMMIPPLFYYFYSEITNYYDYPIFDFNVFSVYNDNLFVGKGWFGIAKENLTNEFAMILFLIGIVFFTFSKEKEEDEFIAQIRAESLLWATYANFIFLALAIVLTYGGGFIHVMIWNLFTIPIIFVIRFRIMLYRNKRALSHAE